MKIAKISILWLVPLALTGYCSMLKGKLAEATNANLSGLSLSAGSLDPVFASKTTAYTTTLPIGIGDVTVTATTEGSEATISVNGKSVTSGQASQNIALNLGENTIEIKVTAADKKTTKTYTIAATRYFGQSAYLKGSGTSSGDRFGYAVAISGDTIVVGAYREDSSETGVKNGTAGGANNSTGDSGAAYVFRKTESVWAQEAYLKGSGISVNDNFGYAVAISGDTIIVGASQEDSDETGPKNGTAGGANDNMANSGAAYVFRRTGTTWVQEAYLKGSNTTAGDQFGVRVAISGDTAVVAAGNEDSSETGVKNGTVGGANDALTDSGAVYVFKRSGAAWAQEAYLKGSGTNASDYFGISVAIDADTIVVGAWGEKSNDVGVRNGTTGGSNNAVNFYGAAYVFKRTGVNWVQEAYLKPPAVTWDDRFGFSVAISGDTIVVGAFTEDSSETGVKPGAVAGADNATLESGAAYVFRRTGSLWAQEAFLKGSNTSINDNFGYSVAIYGDTIVVGAPFEDSDETGVKMGTMGGVNDSLLNSGAVYVFSRSGTTWNQTAFVKGSGTTDGDQFGKSVAISGGTIVVGTEDEDSDETGVKNGTAGGANDLLADTGAAYVFR